MQSVPPPVCRCPSLPDAACPACPCQPSPQGTKACLGWDRVAAALTTGTTAVTDLWLQLLLRTIQAGS